MNPNYYEMLTVIELNRLKSLSAVVMYREVEKMLQSFITDNNLEEGDIDLSFYDEMEDIIQKIINKPLEGVLDLKFTVKNPAYSIFLIEEKIDESVDALEDVYGRGMNLLSKIEKNQVISAIELGAFVTPLGISILILDLTIKPLYRVIFYENELINLQPYEWTLDEGKKMRITLEEIKDRIAKLSEYREREMGNSLMAELFTNAEKMRIVRGVRYAPTLSNN